MPIGAARASVWRRKTTTSSVTNYTLIRYEGHTTSSGTTPGSSNSIYEIYIFTNGYIELRIGNWPGTGGIVGQYTSAGTGVAFPNAGSFSPMTQNVNYLWNSTGTSPTIYLDSQYENGAIVNAYGSLAPSLGAGAYASTWPPAGWTSLQNAHADDQFVTVPISSTTIMGTTRTNAYVGSNFYITFGSGSTNYLSLSTTNPALDKFMFNAADRSYQRVAYKTGSK
jgi:hypothetical protein